MGFASGLSPQVDLIAVETALKGFQLLCLKSLEICDLPLEQWQSMFEKAETEGPQLYPEILSEAMGDRSYNLIRKLISSGLEIKRTVLSASCLHVRSDSQTGRSQ